MKIEVNGLRVQAASMPELRMRLGMSDDQLARLIVVGMRDGWIILATELYRPGKL